jgi:hypothetical protein
MTMISVTCADLDRSISLAFNEGPLTRVERRLVDYHKYESASAFRRRNKKQWKLELKPQ